MTGVLEAVRTAFPSAGVEVLTNASPCAQHSLVVDRRDALPVAEFLRDALGYDFCSNVSGVDWPPEKVSEVVVRQQDVEGVGNEVKETIGGGGFLEAVYHLFSIAKKSAPLTLRVRTGDRADDVSIPSLTPVWKSADFQEREAFDLFGIRFDGHPDLRRILMWDEFTDHPMRKDYVAPDDDEPTPHDKILGKVNPPKEAA